MSTFPETDTPEARLQKLAGKISAWDHAYHTLDMPAVDDATYDAARKEYRDILELNPGLPDVLSSKVGSAPSADFSQLAHTSRMMSLMNLFTDEQALDFDANIREALRLPAGEVVTYCAEAKIDGLSLALNYEAGILVAAKTRGDGSVGEDVLANVRMIADIPQVLKAPYPDALEVRGEVYMSKADFLALNDRLEEAGERPLANPRNAAAGSLRVKDPEVTRRRGLSFFPWGYGPAGTSVDYDTQWDFLKAAESMGFSTCPLSARVSGLEGLLRFFHEVEQERARLAYDIDGVVYKVDNLTLWNVVGTMARAPRYAIAHKFPAERAITTLEDMTCQIGRTGAITPVAELKPVGVGGVIVSRATLHNFEHVERLGLSIGSQVVIQRAGDVVPQVVEVTRPGNGTTLRNLQPTRCPSCNTPLVRDTGAVALRCPGGYGCKAQVQARLSYFVSRPVMDIDGLGPSALELLLDRGFVRMPADLYRLAQHAEDMETMPRWSRLTVRKLLESIERRRQVRLDRFIAALQIEEVGEDTAGRIARHFVTAEAFIEFMVGLAESAHDATALGDIDGVGPTVCQNVTQWAQAEPSNGVLNMGVMANLVSELEIQDMPVVTGGVWSGKTIVFTGTLEHMTRTQAKERAISVGAKVAGSVSARTDLLVIGANAGSKAKKAEGLGVRVMTEQEWLATL